MIRAFPPTQREDGSSLAEILVAIALQAIVLLAVSQFFAASTRAQRTQGEVSNIQESGRFVANVMTSDIRSAGYAGCRHLAELAPNIIANDFADLQSVDDGIQVYDNGSGWSAPAGYTGTSGSDVLVIRYAGRSTHLAGNMAAENANIQVENNPGELEAGDVVLITDCIRSDIFRATSVSNDNGNGNNNVTIAHASNANTTNRLSKTYDASAFVYTMRQITYFVGSDGTTQGLYRQASDFTDPVLLTDDVTALSATLTNDETGVAIGVHYALLVATDDGVTTTSLPFTFEGATLNASNGDTRLRKSFVGFANIRNNSP